MYAVSVVLPTYNRLGRLKQVLAGLEAQRHPLDQFEVVVVSDGSTDGTHGYLRALETPLRLTFVEQANQGPAAARNAGVARASGELVLFIDDDVVPEPELIGEHLQAHAAEPGALVVLGPMLTPAGFAMRPWVRWEQAMLDKQYADMAAGRWEPTARQFYTGNASLARRHLLEAGGFDPAFRRAEDVELAYRLARRGLRFVFAPRAVGYHYAERSFRSWLDTPYAYGRNDVIFSRDGQAAWLLPTVFREFHNRNALVRLIVRLCVGRQPLQGWAIRGLQAAAALGERAGVARVARMAYSGIFNLRYYQGVADELGDHRLLRQGIHTYA